MNIPLSIPQPEDLTKIAVPDIARKGKIEIRDADIQRDLVPLFRGAICSVFKDDQKFIERVNRLSDLEIAEGSYCELPTQFEYGNNCLTIYDQVEFDSFDDLPDFIARLQILQQKMQSFKDQGFTIEEDHHDSGVVGFRATKDIEVRDVQNALKEARKVLGV